MRMIIFAVVLLTVYLAVDSAPAACNKMVGKMSKEQRQQARGCAKYLTDLSRLVARHVRENNQFDKETVEAGKELAEGEIKPQGRTKAERKVEAAEKLALIMNDNGYKFRVDPHGSKADVMLPSEAYKDDTPEECKTLITGFVERNTHAGRSE